MLFIDWQPSLEALQIGSFSLRWYSLCWCIGLIFAYTIVHRLYKQQNISEKKFEPLFFYCFFGILIGARLGHCIFYEPGTNLTFLQCIAEMILPVRFLPDGGFEFVGYSGLASHGGTIGLFLALMLYVKKHQVPVFQLLDNIAIATPLTACCIRLGNLMNSEIYGGPTDLPWGFIFVRDGQTVACHPTQIYEMLYCLVALIITWPLYWKTNARRREGLLLGIFLEIIFLTRFCLEFIKNDQEAFEAGQILNMGQILSIPFILLGIYLIIRAYTRPMLPVVDIQPESLEPKYQTEGNKKNKK